MQFGLDAGGCSAGISAAYHTFAHYTLTTDLTLLMKAFLPFFSHQMLVSKQYCLLLVAIVPPLEQSSAVDADTSELGPF